MKELIKDLIKKREDNIQNILSVISKNYLSCNQGHLFRAEFYLPWQKFDNGCIFADA